MSASSSRRIVVPGTARHRGRSGVCVAVPATSTATATQQEFDPAAAPPFGLGDIRAAIPKHCWVKDPWRSMGYVVRDVVLVLGLAAAAARLDSWLVWPLYWAAQGTMFWALFVLGHDCGHGSFSNNPILNSVVGHILHSSIHQNHGHVDKDESWHPVRTPPLLSCPS